MLPSANTMTKDATKERTETSDEVEKVEEGM